MNNEVVYLDIDCRGETTGKHYQAQIEMKLFLSLKEKMESSKLKSKLLKDVGNDDDLFYVLTILANLNPHIINKPNWWIDEGTNLKDIEPILKLGQALREAQEAEVNPPKEEKEPEEDHKEHTKKKK